ncbi:MAG: kelch repeat-containing protein [Polyangia bacterium]
MISDACDECPDLSGWANATDQDEDGYSGSLDNCPCEFNPDQDDCDGDGWGDACDPTPCIRFHGAGVGSAASKGSNAMLWTETPSLIPVHYRTIGEGTHDVQVRWCDCMNPLAVGDYSWSECTQYNCTQADPADDYEVHFLHERWHIASTNSTPQLSELEPVSVPDADHKLRVDCPWYSNDWSDVQPDEQTGLEAYHCTPRKTDYDCLFNEHTTYWDWQNELWWRDVQAGDGLPFKEAPGRGFVWIRAESDAVGYPNTLRATVNFYDTFELPIPHGVPNPILKFSWPTPLDDIPFEELVTPVDEIAGGLGEPVDGDLLGGSAIVLYSLSDAAGEVIGKYAYPGDGFGADAAIAGIMVVFADPHGLGPSAIGYSVAAGPAGAPTTTGFAAARVPGSLARFDGSYPTSSGIALFGGELSDGSKDGRLWLGSYAGVDGEGTPYIAWTDVTPPAGNSPPPRSGAGMVFDGQTERLLLLGGEGAAGEALGDMWAFDLATSQWQQLTPLAGLPALSGFSLAACGGDAYLLGGLRGDGSMNTIVYRLDERAVEIVGDLEAGPGGRERFASTCFFEPDCDEGIGKLLVYGGTDGAATLRGDLWELNTSTGEWSLRIEEREGFGSPRLSERRALLSSARGDFVTLYTDGDNGLDLYFTTGPGEKAWEQVAGERAEPAAVDCDGDGVPEPETAKRCRESDAWYAELGGFVCPAGPGGDLFCAAPFLEEKQPIASWSPAGWEWIVDFAAEGSRFSYVLTDATLYTFDLAVISDPLAPVDVDEIELPGDCLWCGGPDWSFDVEMRDDYLYVGSWGGVHVLSLADPADPVEVAFYASYGPVLGMAALDAALYLADDFGVTVLSIEDPTAPDEVGRLGLGALALDVGVNVRDRRLTVLTPLSLRSYSLDVPDSPAELDRVPLAGLLYDSMRVDGRWTYLSGLGEKSVHDGEDGLEKRGGHDLQSWVEGRALWEDLASRVRRWQNVYEVWGDE